MFLYGKCTYRKVKSGWTEVGKYLEKEELKRKLKKNIKIYLI
jgi:hypothetical protein